MLIGMTIGAVRAVKLPTTAFSLTSHSYVEPFFFPERYFPGTKTERVFTDLLAGLVQY